MEPPAGGTAVASQSSAGGTAMEGIQPAGVTAAEKRSTEAVDKSSRKEQRKAEPKGTKREAEVPVEDIDPEQLRKKSYCVDCQLCTSCPWQDILSGEHSTVVRKPMMSAQE